MWPEAGEADWQRLVHRASWACLPTVCTGHAQLHTVGPQSHRPSWTRPDHVGPASASGAGRQRVERHLPCAAGLAAMGSTLGAGPELRVSALHRPVPQPGWSLATGQVQPAPVNCPLSERTCSHRKGRRRPEPAAWPPFEVRQFFCFPQAQLPQQRFCHSRLLASRGRPDLLRARRWPPALPSPRLFLLRRQHRTTAASLLSGPQGWGSHRGLQLSGQSVLESPGWELPVSGSVFWKALVRQEIRREGDDVEDSFPPNTFQPWVW